VRLIILLCVASITVSAQRTMYPNSCEPGASPARVCVVGDVQRRGLYETWRERNDSLQVPLLNSLAAEAPTEILLLGDQVFDGASKDDWRWYDLIMAKVNLLGVPIRPLYGNHEYWTSERSMHKQMKRRFSCVEPRTWYRVISDSIAYIMLNSNYKDVGFEAMRRQAGWFASELKHLQHDSSVLAIVVASHHPPFTNSTIVSGDNFLRRAFVPQALRTPKVVLWLSGHCHNYEHFLEERTLAAGDELHFVVSGGGGGPRHPLDLEDPRYKDLYGKAVINPLHYLVITRSNAQLTILVKGLDPVTKDMYTLDTFITTFADEHP
jgi:hypothetical protein